ncbi:alpha/beta hydrolase family protein [Roseivirga pacifica]|uniref:alpha/beta hydrolase family protein n=1 Tax=Roseivirga pacifica TaxID=1267423 RepID=UPI00227AE410|nr:alpha/beta hydrolase [Roseivirga pacifica]
MENQINIAGMERQPTSTARMPKELLEKAKKQMDEISEEDYAKVMGLVAVCKREWRSILHKTPDDYGMTGWEDIYFPADDGVPISGWYIPAKGGESDKLIIFNHALPMSRAGFQGHMGMPWAGFIDIEIDFVVQMKILTDAGYNVLAYDMRNHGQSGTANNGMSGIGQLEWRDCVGAKKYVDAHPRLSKMKVALFNQCLGGISQWVALDKHPELFENVKCFVSPLVPNMRNIYRAFSELYGVPQYLELLDFELLRAGGFTMDEMDPRKYTKNVTMPLIMWQVARDSWTKNPESAQSTFDSIPGNNKELIWVDSDNRFKDGYNYFGRTPEKVLAFLDKHMK